MFSNFVNKIYQAVWTKQTFSRSIHKVSCVFQNTKATAHQVPIPANEDCSNICKETGPLKNKIAVVTGGGAGIGLECAKAMLRNSLEGVTIVDVDSCKGEYALEQIAEEFGENRAIFVKCDVTKSELVDWAFKNTLKNFKRVDIVVNNAGILNDRKWEKQIQVNMNGYVIVSLLALQYMSKYCIGKGGTLVNVASIMGLEPYSGCPLHTMTQHGIIGLTRALGFGDHYEKTCVRVMGLCAGFTDTELMADPYTNMLNKNYAEEFKRELKPIELQDPSCVGIGLIKALTEGCNASLWIAEDSCEAYEVRIPDINKMMVVKK